MPTILEEAQEAIFGARNVAYGHPRDNFTHTAKLWSAHKGVEFSAQEVAEFMVLLKLSRLQNGYHRDSVVDIAGYAGTIERLQEPVEPTAPDRSPWPRLGSQTWHDLREVPLDVTVVDKDGDQYWYHFQQRRWYWVQRERYLDDEDLAISPAFAPFTVAVDL
jgi:hypothetical protein